MLIISQDKDKIINFEQIASLYVDSWSNKEFATEPNCFCIKGEKVSDNLICMFLGKYATEERAKEVLQEIYLTFVINKTMELYANIGNMSQANKNNMAYTPVYQMLKE